jgi:CRISPR-associated protein Csd1
MSWIDKLYQTYNNCVGAVSGSNNEESQLLPICHTTQNAQIRVYIDHRGEFNRAETISKEKASTITPCTENSGSRAGIRPVNHPLFDKLQYTAGDFIDYGGVVTSGYARNPREPHDQYMADLLRWCQSPSKHFKIELVFQYLKKGCLIKDLVDFSILFSGDDGKLLNEWKGEKGKPEIFKLLPGGKDSKGNAKPWQADAFVIFSVEIPENPQSDLNSDKTVWESWIDYYCSLKSDMGVCYITGENSFLSDQHPAKIRNTGDKAKIVSANDNSGFTYRGKFSSDKEACTIGFEASQKAHNALRWLIQRQGFRDGDLAVVAWAVSGQPIPNPFSDTDELFNVTTEKSESEPEIYTAQNFGIRLSKMMAGYSARLGNTDQIVVMGLDSATTGRLSVIYFRELRGSEFLNRIQDWHEQCAWIHKYPKTKNFVGAPAPKDITEAAYGVRVDGSLKKATIKRIIHSIIDGAEIPKDLLIATRRQASKKQSLENWEWEKALGIACSLYKYDNKERGYCMALEHDRKTRAYLYGRLLAVADCLEGFALSSAEKGRPTNAARLMQRFADYPCSTWRNIELSLTPHRARLGAKSKKYDEALKEIMDLFITDDFIKDEPLDGEFLLGYHTQRTDLMKSTKTENITDITYNEQEV